MQLILYKIFTF